MKDAPKYYWEDLTPEDRLATLKGGTGAISNEGLGSRGGGKAADREYAKSRKGDGLRKGSLSVQSHVKWTLHHKNP
jgi:hypothetical protein